MMLVAQTDGDPFEAGVGLILSRLHGYYTLWGGGRKAGEVNPVNNVVLVPSQWHQNKIWV